MIENILIHRQVLIQYNLLALATNIRNWSPNHFYQIDILESLLALIQNKMKKKE